MDLDRVAVDLRPRSGWEAIDVGFRLARRSYLRLVLAALAITLPLYALSVAVFWSWPLFIWLLPWWAKPIWERSLLFMVSREFFGERVTAREGIASLRTSWRRDALPWLTVRRFSPTRCIDLPITVLEGSTGEARSRRIDLIRQGDLATAAFWLTVVGAHVEVVLPMAGLTLVDLLVPSAVEWSAWSWYFVGEQGTALQNVLGGLLGVVSSAAVAPFYVAGGFSLYVHRRTVLEGWDLQIAFGRLARRIAAHGRVAAMLAGALLLAAAAPPETRAESLHAPAAGERVEAARAEARDDIEQVLAGPQFHAQRTWMIPRFLRDLRLDPPHDEPPLVPEWLRTLVLWLAESVEVILVALILSALLFVAWRFRHVEVPRRSAAAGRRRRPARIMGMDLSEASLPDDVAAAARAEWRAGRLRPAMALLYRASLVRLVDDHAVELRESDTEAQCLRAARARLDGERLGLFAEITRAWSTLAYGHRPPGEQAFESLTFRFERHFALPSSSAVEHG